MKNILAGCVLSFFFLTGVSTAADGIKIGVVDFQKILEVSNAGKTAKNEINQQGKQMETDLKDRNSEIADIEKKIEHEFQFMNKEALEESQRALRIKIGDFKDLQQKYMETLKAQESQSVSRIQKEVDMLVKEIGEKEGYTMIVEKRTGGVVYRPLSIDITDAVIQIYNTLAPKSESKKTLDTVDADLCRLEIHY